MLLSDPLTPKRRKINLKLSYLMTKVQKKYVDVNEFVKLFTGPSNTSGTDREKMATSTDLIVEAG